MLQVLEQGMKIERQTMIRDLDDAVSMLCFFERQKEWATKTFGDASHRGPNGPLYHLAKEAMEAIQETDPEKKKEEISDCLFVTFEAAWRHGMTFGDLVRYAEKKLEKNKARRWPPLSEQKPGKAVEHVRDVEAEPALAEGFVTRNGMLQFSCIDLGVARETLYGVKESEIKRPEKTDEQLDQLVERIRSEPNEDETGEFVDMHIGEHTAEPWEYVEDNIDENGYAIEPAIYAEDGSEEGTLICRLSLPLITIPKREDEIRTRFNGDIHANGQRIVDCVNAMAGVENPPGFMQVVDELLQAYFVGPWNRTVATEAMLKVKNERGQI